MITPPLQTILKSHGIAMASFIPLLFVRLKDIIKIRQNEQITFYN